MLDPIFGTSKVLIGVVHLLPIPGSPRWQGSMEPILARAREEAIALEEWGADGVIVENFGDAPFVPGPVEAHTVAAMTLAVRVVRESISLSVGINMLRNDPRPALAVAVATGARFIRVNVHYGVMVAEEGLIHGKAFETLRYRRALAADGEVKVLADVLVKHAVPLGDVDLAQAARETGLPPELGPLVMRVQPPL